MPSNHNYSNNSHNNSHSNSQSQRESQSRDSLSWQRKQRIRTLFHQINTFDDDAPVTEDTAKKLEQVVDEARQISEEAKTDARNIFTSESLLSSKLLCATSQVVLQCATKISSNTNAYDWHELADNIKSNPSFWSSISLPKQIPPFSFLYGTFAAGPPIEKERKPRKPINKPKTLSQARKPDVLQTVKNAESDVEAVLKIKKIVKRHYKANDREPFSFLHLVINPNSFTKTVENIYHTSFLVRDGEVSIKVDKEMGLPVIKPISKDEKEARVVAGADNNNQFIFSIDFQNWEEAISALQITKAMIE